MMETRLQLRLRPLAQMLRDTRLYRALTIGWLVAATVGLALYVAEILIGRAFHEEIFLVPLILAVILAAVVVIRQKGRADDFLEVIREIEPHQPEVQHLMLAAAEQRPAKDSAAFNFLQLRVIEEALAHPGQADWRRKLGRRLARAQIAFAGAFGMLILVTTLLHRTETQGAPVFASLLRDEITVTPGDTQVERGTGLVIAARFGGTPPGEATLVLNSATGKESRLAMSRRLADPVFGASLAEVSEPGVYHVEYRGKKTRDFKIAIFEFPALVRADAELHYPAYTGLTNRTIRDTLRVSAVEGSHLSYSLQLNKPVVRARWVGQEQSITLATQSNAVAILPDYLLTNSARYALELLDADGRTNKFPTDFILQALTNQPAVVKLVFPKGDPRVSPLQEVQLQAEASDDFGLVKYGIGYGLAGQEPQFVELGQSAPANAKRQFNYVVSLESLGADVDQVVAYFAWADDYGPDGQVRRTFSDMYFAEVRPFEEVFRQDQSGAGDNANQGGSRGQGQGQGQAGGGDPRVRLTDLQKQIVIATWNLQREKPGAGGAQHP
jgi:hypothetical protein